MKTRVQKITSLVLTLVMLFTMIPMGIFTATAEGADYTIDSAAAWNELAAQNLTFEGKTVVLGADIDAGGAALATLSQDFKGTFDGQGKTISNATVAGKALFANAISGSATIKNLKLVNVDLTSTGEAGLLAATVNDGTIVVTKINVDATSSVSAAGVAGGLIATTALTADTSSLTISYVQNEAAVTTGAFHAGGLIGQDNSTKGNIAIDTVVTKSIVTHTGATKSAGVIGYITGVNTQNAQVISLSNLVVGGTQSGSTAHSSMANDTVFFCMAYGTVNYEKIYVLPGTSSYTMEIAYYASWMNGFQWSTGREKLTIAQITVDGRTDPPTELTEAEAQACVKIGEDGFLTKIVDPNCEHDWSEYSLESSPTQNDVGIEKRTCSKCGVVDIKETPALGWTVEEFLADYDNRTAANIQTADDWNALAAAGKTFEGKTVNLCADISGITAPLADTFRGKFFGKNFTISNATISDSGIIAKTLSGNAAVKNLKLVNVDVTSTGEAGLIATAVTDGTIVISKLNVDAASSVTGKGIVGGLFATTSFTAATSSLNISFVMMDATVTTGDFNAGGLIGQDDSTRGTISVDNTATRAIVTHTGATKSGGVIGYITGVNIQNAQVISLSNIIVGGTQSGSTGHFSSANDCAFFCMGNGTLNYDSLYVLPGTSAYTMEINFWASWMNGFQWSDTIRAKLTIANIIEDGRTNPPKMLNPEINALTLDDDGFIAKVGRPLETPTLDLTNYDTTETFTIKNLADWELIAASGKDFANKKIVLDADIDAWNEKVSTLTDTFKGSFDGQGHTFANATMLGGGVIANTIEASSDVTIENLVLDYVSINYKEGNAGLIAGTVKGSDAYVTIQKINATHSNVTSTGYTGGLIGYLKVTTALKAVEANIRQVSVAATVKSIAANMQAGGLIGHDASLGANETNTVTMNISDSIVSCTVTAVSNACGLIGQYTGGNIENGSGVLANAKNSAYLNLSNLVLGGGTNFKICWMNNGVLNYQNIYLLDPSGNLFGANQYGSWLNGVVTNTAGGSGRGAITVETITAAGMQAPKSIVLQNAEKMTSMDEDGFIQSIPDYVQVVAVQQSIEVGDTYALRFVAPSQFGFDEITNVNMTVVATWLDASTVKQTKIFSTVDEDCVDENGDPASGCIFYNYLTVYSEHGVATKNVTAGNLGAKMITGFTVWNIPVDAENIPSGITFEATMTYTNPLGQSVTSRTVTVTVDAAGVIQ